MGGGWVGDGGGCRVCARVYCSVLKRMCRTDSEARQRASLSSLPNFHRNPNDECVKLHHDQQMSRSDPVAAQPCTAVAPPRQSSPDRDCAPIRCSPSDERHRERSRTLARAVAPRLARRRRVVARAPRLGPGQGGIVRRHNCRQISSFPAHAGTSTERQQEQQSREPAARAKDKYVSADAAAPVRC